MSEWRTQLLQQQRITINSYLSVFPVMKKQIVSPILSILFLCFCFSVSAQDYRRLVATYYNNDMEQITVRLYADSTVDYIRIGSNIFKVSRWTKRYRITDTSLVILTEKPFAVVRKKYNRYNAVSYPIKDGKLYFYTKEQELAPPNADFIPNRILQLADRKRTR